MSLSPIGLSVVIYLVLLYILKEPLLKTALHFLRTGYNNTNNHSTIN